ncbi:hypothetical protein AVEN_87842-1 [Araneus ventricosus]|uniref:Uncharacterized protein n=1 Tax=Araneus ventricosus TaxID=182803 RepID=A0A4Y2BBV5_ARAVE|nr:hypothetical protein AVEN_87842-1 [Araneus ventricosus]
MDIGGLLVRSRLRNWNSPYSKLDSTKYPLWMWVGYTPNLSLGVSHACVHGSLEKDFPAKSSSSSDQGSNTAVPKHPLCCFKMDGNLVKQILNLLSLITPVNQWRLFVQVMEDFGGSQNQFDVHLNLSQRRIYDIEY